MRERWIYKNLGECFPYIKNGANIKHIKGAKGYPITRIETLSGGVFNRDRMGYADIFDINKFQDYVLRNGDLLMSHINSKAYIGRTVKYTSQNDEVIIHGMNLLRLKSNEQLIQTSFFKYYTDSRHFKSDIARIRKDAVNQSSFAISDLRLIVIPVPSLSEQQSIVTELDKINELISLKKAQLSDLDSLALSIFYEMFGDPIENEKGWEQKRIGDVCAEKKDIKRASKCFDGSDDIQYIDISSINNTSNCIIGITSFSFDEAPSRAQQKVEKGDILVSLVRPNLKNIAIVNIDEDNLVASSGFCVLRATKSSNHFIKTLVLTPHFTEYLVKRVTGANYPAVREDDIRNCSIGAPPLALQQTFSKRIDAIEVQKEQIISTINDLETLLASRMQYWFE